MKSSGSDSPKIATKTEIDVNEKRRRKNFQMKRNREETNRFMVKRLARNIEEVTKEYIEEEKQLNELKSHKKNNVLNKKINEKKRLVAKLKKYIESLSKTQLKHMPKDNVFNGEEGEQKSSTGQVVNADE